MSVELQVVHRDHTVCGLIIGSGVGISSIYININLCFVKFFEGVFQADSVSVIWFFLCVILKPKKLNFIRISFCEHIICP
jgi:hypothetical protein